MKHRRTAMGYFVQAAARLTEEERADLSAIVNKPDLDVEVFSELISRADVAVNIEEDYGNGQRSEYIND
jgi:hypothetical protein